MHFFGVLDEVENKALEAERQRSKVSCTAPACVRSAGVYVLLASSAAHVDEESYLAWAGFVLEELPARVPFAVVVDYRDFGERGRRHLGTRSPARRRQLEEALVALEIAHRALTDA